MAAAVTSAADVSDAAGISSSGDSVEIRRTSLSGFFYQTCATAAKGRTATAIQQCDYRFKGSVDVDVEKFSNPSHATTSERPPKCEGSSSSSIKQKALANPGKTPAAIGRYGLPDVFRVSGNRRSCQHSAAAAILSKSDSSTDTRSKPPTAAR